MDMKASTILEAVACGVIAGHIMECTYWTGHGIFCAVVMGCLSWAAIAILKEGKEGN